VCQGVPLVKGQFCVPIVGFSHFFEKYPCSDMCVCIGHGYDEVGRRYQNNQGLTKEIQHKVMRRNNMTIFGLTSQVQYLNIPWAINNCDHYIKAIDKINDCYRKMLMIGKCNEVFRPSNDKVPDLLLVNLPINSNWPKKIFNKDLNILKIRFCQVEHHNFN
jgi:hypothetical protein